VRRRGEAGSASLELVVLAPAIIALLGLVVLAGHVETAHQVVGQAAEDAARAASLSRSASTTNVAAHAAASADLSGRDCRTWTVSLGGALSPGATLTAQVACSTPLGILPGTFTATASAGAVVDTYRGATP
jgi:Flp pilus assembly protein TadG